MRKPKAMSTLTVTARGQVTFRKDVLQHLGIGPGEKIEVDKLPDGRVTLKAARPAGTIDGFLGLLAGKTAKVATVEEIEAAALLKEAEIIAVPLPCLCEFVWVLRRVYGFRQDDIAAAIEALLEAGNVA